jgi:hypothetical protein
MNHMTELDPNAPAEEQHDILITRARLYPEVARPGPAWVWTYNYYVDGGPPCQWGPGLASLRDRLRRKYGATARVREEWKSPQS